MAKKKHKKKHAFKQRGPVAAPAAVAKPKTTTAASPAVSNEWQVVRADVRLALILAGIFISIQIGLWFFINR